MQETTLSFYASFLNEGIILIDHKSGKVKPEQKVYEPILVSEPEEVYVSDIIFKGTNSSKVAVLVYYEQEEWITVKDRLFLEKILEATKISFDSIALINMHRAGYKNIDLVGQKLPGNKIISFGLPGKLTTSLEANNVSEFNGQHYICMQWGLTDIAMSKDKKNLLWKNLKKLFGL